MKSQPTGSLSSNELLENSFVVGCEVNWTCTNGTGIDYHEVAISFKYSIAILGNFRGTKFSMMLHFKTTFL